MIGWTRTALAALAVFFGSHGGAIAANTAPVATASQSIKVIHFPGGTALPLYVASAKGFFAAAGVTVQLTPTFNSKQLMSGVLEKQYDIGNAAIDNLIAYQEMQAAPDLKVERDLVAFMGTSSTNLDLVVQPAIKSYADLKGKTLAVDAPNTGFAFVLRKMLAIGGLSETDYQFAAIGGDSARLDALKAGKAAGALLTTGFVKQAMAAGLTRLGTSLDALHHYQGTSFFTRRSWATAHRGELVKFIHALRQAHAWIFDSKNRDEAAQIFVDHSKGLTLDIAKSTVAQLTSPAGGLSRTGALDSEGIKVVLALRNQYGTPKRDLNDPGKYIDTSYYKAAEPH
jgi:ABC-type nitrate/sulfonate/bicarbonate transport system substrate-binding protein